MFYEECGMQDRKGRKYIVLQDNDMVAFITDCGIWDASVSHWHLDFGTMVLHQYELEELYNLLEVFAKIASIADIDDTFI